jgi:hypothetical protein
MQEETHRFVGGEQYYGLESTTKHWEGLLSLVFLEISQCQGNLQGFQQWLVFYSIFEKASTPAYLHNFRLRHAVLGFLFMVAGVSQNILFVLILSCLCFKLSPYVSRQWCYPRTIFWKIFPELKIDRRWHTSWLFILNYPILTMEMKPFLTGKEAKSNLFLLAFHLGLCWFTEVSEWMNGWMNELIN